MRLKQIIKGLFRKKTVDIQGKIDPPDVTAATGVGVSVGAIVGVLTPVLEAALPLLPKLVTDPETNAAVAGLVAFLLFLARRFKQGSPVALAPAPGATVGALAIQPINTNEQVTLDVFEVNK